MAGQPHLPVCAPAGWNHSRRSARGREGFALAKSDLYPTELLRGRRPSTRYAMSALELAEERIALAGYRLAHLLEQELGEPPTGDRAKP